LEGIASAGGYGQRGQREEHLGNTRKSGPEDPIRSFGEGPPQELPKCQNRPEKDVRKYWETHSKRRDPAAEGNRSGRKVVKRGKTEGRGLEKKSEKTEEEDKGGNRAGESRKPSRCRLQEWRKKCRGKRDG